MSTGYPVPSGRHRLEISVQRSRFIATLAPAPDEAAVVEFLQSVRAEFPDATHHCWAFVAGPAGDTARVGMSDDGEPHGTAGRPMLTTLLHSGVGEVAAVVTRFYGGVKLGKGGLSRAYSGAVSEALASLATVQRIERIDVRVRLAFAAAGSLFRLLEALGAEGRGEDYTEDGALEVRTRLPKDALSQFEAAIAGLTAGAGVVTVEGQDAGSA
jgi:uncharacterized YigZ family protein